jgi:hypothetical protein
MDLKMKRSKTLISIIILSFAFLLTCCKENPLTSISGEIKGTVTNQGADGTVKGVPQLKIYLLDMSVKPDSINLENNKKLFIDSTFTDADGNYKFQNLKEGKYGVSINTGSSDILAYKEQSSPDPTEIVINDQKQAITINFSVTYPEDYPSEISTYDLNVKFKNLKWGTYTTYIYRYEYYCFIPVLMSNYRMEMGQEYQFNRGFNFKMTYGATMLFYTMSNKYRFTIQRLGEDTYTFEYDLTLSACPSSATFEYDYEAKTFTRIN